MPQIVLNHRLRQVAPGAHPARPVRSQASADNVDSAPPEAARGCAFGRAAASPFAVGLQAVRVRSFRAVAGACAAACCSSIDLLSQPRATNVDYTQWAITLTGEAVWGSSFTVNPDRNNNPLP